MIFLWIFLYDTPAGNIPHSGIKLDLEPPAPGQLAPADGCIALSPQRVIAFTQAPRYVLLYVILPA